MRKKAPEYNIQFIVQIGVWNNDIDSETQQKIESIGGVVKILEKGNLYKYIVLEGFLLFQKARV